MSMKSSSGVFILNIIARSVSVLI